MTEADVVSLLGEPSSCESRRDDEAPPRKPGAQYFEEEQRRVARRGPLRRLSEFAEVIQSEGPECKAEKGMSEPGEPRRDDEGHLASFDDKPRRIERRVPLRRLVTSAEDI